MDPIFFHNLMLYHLPGVFGWFLGNWVLFGVPSLLLFFGVGIFFKRARCWFVSPWFPILGLVFGLSAGYFEAWDDHRLSANGINERWYDVFCIFGGPGDSMANSYVGDWQADEAWDYRSDITVWNGLFWMSIAVAGTVVIHFATRRRQYHKINPIPEDTPLDHQPSSSQ